MIGGAALAAALALALALFGAPASTDQAASPAVSLCPDAAAPQERESMAHSPDRFVPIWSDEFDAPARASVDPSRWLLKTGGLGWGVGELQAYTDSPTNIAYSGDGSLVITARREPGDGGAQFTSARVSTCGRFEFNHGRVEARILLPKGQGLWPAFWLLGAQPPWPFHGEIDILESINDMARVESNLHQPLADGTDWEKSGASALHPSGSWANDYHVYAVDWTEDAVTWSVDGAEYATVTRADTPPEGEWVIDRAPQVIVLNLAIGGYPGSPTATTPFPAEMRIDYVRVFANDDTAVSYAAG